MELVKIFHFPNDDKLFLKDPSSSDLGIKILKNSIEMIDKMGFEAFTFKKLGAQIRSNESSIYRYFENKHKLLLYISSLYWDNLEHQLQNIIKKNQPSLEKLQEAIIEITAEIPKNRFNNLIDGSALNRVIIANYLKTYLTIEIDKENEAGYYLVYEKVIQQLSALILEVKPDYIYSKTLASSIVAGTLNQHFFNQHLTEITDFSENGKTISAFYNECLEKILL